MEPSKLYIRFVAKSSQLLNCSLGVLQESKEEASSGIKLALVLSKNNNKNDNTFNAPLNGGGDIDIDTITITIASLKNNKNKIRIPYIPNLCNCQIGDEKREKER